MQTDQLLTTAEVSKYYNRPAGTLRQWRHRHYRPRGFLVGGIVMYRRSEVDRWLAEQEQAGVPA